MKCLREESSLQYINFTHKTIVDIYLHITTIIKHHAFYFLKKIVFLFVRLFIYYFNALLFNVVLSQVDVFLMFWKFYLNQTSIKYFLIYNVYQVILKWMDTRKTFSICIILSAIFLTFKKKRRKVGKYVYNVSTFNIYFFSHI